MSRDLGNKIILSLSYTDQFKYPLTKEEIFLRLIGVDDSTSLEDVVDVLSDLVEAGKFFLSSGFYFLKSSADYVETRLQREKFSFKKWLEVKEFVELVRFIPWISGIVVTGSLAVNNAKKNDDIDFLIITKKKRLWLSRILVAFLLLLKGKKRSWNGAEANSWCLNLWLDDAALELPSGLRNIYGAFEVSQAIWVYDKGETKKKFFELNNWAERFLPNYFRFQKGNDSLVNFKVADRLGGVGKVADEVSGCSDCGGGKKVGAWVQKFFVFNFLLDFADAILFFIQYLYMKPHMTSEKVSKNFAFFHPRDTKRQVFGRWLRRFKENE